MIFTFLCLLVLYAVTVCNDPTFKVLSGVPQCKKAVPHLMEKIHLLDKRYSGMSSYAAGHECNVKELTIY